MADNRSLYSYARELYGRDIQVEIGGNAGDAYAFHVGDDNTLHVKTSNARGVLYAVYDALSGRRIGQEAPEFAIRGLNPCESLNRHTPEQLERLIDRMGRWRMNTLIIHSNYGFQAHRELIEREAAKRGIELVHYTYSNLCFMDGIAPAHFAKGDDGKPRWARAECETRLCASDAEGLAHYARNVAGYLAAHPDFDPLIFCTADGTHTCRCPSCRALDAWGQWYPIFNPFFDSAHGQRRLEALLYQQRWSVPEDLSRIRQLDRLLFDKLGIDGVVYEAFEPGIGPFLPTFDAIAATMWDLQTPYTPTDFERVYLDADDEEFWGFLPGHPKWESHRGDYPRETLAKLLYRFQSLKPLAFQPAQALGTETEAVECCREILNYVLDHPRREEFDWIYIAFYTLKKAQRFGALTPNDEREREFLESVKLWDFQERHRPPREAAIGCIESLRAQLGQRAKERKRQ